MNVMHIDQIRGLVIAGAAALGVDQSVHLFAESMPGLNDAFLMQIAEKGGGWVVLLIVLFFYRRDYQRLTTAENDGRKESNEVRKELLAAIYKQAESEQKLAVALVQNTEVMQRVIDGDHR